MTGLRAVTPFNNKPHRCGRLQLPAPAGREWVTCWFWTGDLVVQTVPNRVLPVDSRSSQAEPRRSATPFSAAFRYDRGS